MPNNIIIVK